MPSLCAWCRTTSWATGVYHSTRVPMASTRFWSVRVKREHISWLLTTSPAIRRGFILQPLHLPQSLRPWRTCLPDMAFQKVSGVTTDLNIPPMSLETPRRCMGLNDRCLLNDLYTSTKSPNSLIPLIKRYHMLTEPPNDFWPLCISKRNIFPHLFSVFLGESKIIICSRQLGVFIYTTARWWPLRSLDNEAVKAMNLTTLCRIY